MSDTTKRKVDIETSLDASGVRAGAEEVKDSLKGISTTAQSESTKTGSAIEKIGKSAEKSAADTNRAYSRFESEIRRVTAAMQAQAEGTGKAGEIINRAMAQGLDVSRLDPAIQKLRDLEKGLGVTGISAKQMSASLRGVPAQFTDIITSLQSGQAPLTVFLQQGGQLKDMFGGAGNAAKALGGYIVGLINPFTIAAAAVAGLGYALYSLNGKDAALLALSAQLQGTGRASAAAVDDIKALVNELNNVPGVSKSAATSIVTEFAKVQGIGGSLFKELGSSVADFAVATGTDIPAAARKLADAFADPAKGAKTLEDTLGTLTAAQILTIEKMVAIGDKAGAQAVLMDALKQATKGLADEAMTPMGKATEKLSNSWDMLTSSMGNSSAFRAANDGLAMLIEKAAELATYLSKNISLADVLSGLPMIGPAVSAAYRASQMLPSAQTDPARTSSGKIGGLASNPVKAEINETEKQIKQALELTRSYESQGAAMEKLRGVAKVAKDALKELETQNRGNSVEAQTLRDRIAGVNEKLDEMSKRGRKASGGSSNNDAAQQYAAAIAQEKDYLTTRLTLIKENIKQGLLSEEQGAIDSLAAQQSTYQAQKSLLEKQLSETSDLGKKAQIGKELAAIGNDADVALAKYKSFFAEASKARQEYMGKQIQSMNSDTLKLAEDNDKLREQIDLLGLSADQIGELEASKLRAAESTELLEAANLREAASQIEVNDANKAAIDYYNKLADAKEAHAKALGERASLQIEMGAKKSAIEVEKQWQKTSEKIGDSITDALMRGFESGKTFAASLRDTIVNMFNTMVLRPVIQATVMGGLSAIGMGSAGATELPGSGGMSGVGNLLSMGNSAYSAYSGGFGGLYTDFATSGIGSALGLSTGLSTSLGVAGGAGSVMGSSAALAAAEATSLGGASAISGLGSAVGTAIPIIGGVLAIGSLLGGLFESGERFKRLATSSTGTYKDGKFTNTGEADYYKDGADFGEPTNKALVQLNKSFSESLGELFESLGEDVEMSTDARIRLRRTSGKLATDFFATLNGVDIALQTQYGKDAENISESIQQFFTDVMSKGIVKAIEASPLDDALKALFSDLDGTEQVGSMVTNLTQLGKHSSGLNDIWGISVVQAAKVATATSETNEELIAAVGIMGSVAASQQGIGETLAKTYAELSESFSGLAGSALPDSLRDYDAAMKAVNKTTEEGLNTFSELFSLREEFAAFQSVIDALKGNVDAAVYDLKTDAEKVALAQKALDEASEKAGVSSISSAGDLLRLAESIDYTTEAGINLAAALPGLVSAFNTVASARSAVEETQASRIAAYLNAQHAAQVQSIADQRQAYEDQLSSAQSIADEFGFIVDSLSDYRRSLLVGEDSTLTPEQKYAEAKRQLELTTAKARLGDVDAAGQMQSATDDFLKAAKEYRSTSSEFAVDFGQAIAGLDSVIGSASRQSSYAEQQIALAQAQLDVLNSISVGLSGQSSTTPELPLVVDNFSQAMADWQEWFNRVAIGQSEEYGIGTTTRISKDKGIFTDTAGNSYTFSATEGPYGLADQSKVWAEEMIRRYGQWKIPGFASGGEFSGGLRIVGENGPELEVTKPSRIYSNSDTKNIFDNTAIINELKSLRDEVRAGQSVIANNTRGTTKILERVIPDGDAISVRAAA